MSSAVRFCLEGFILTVWPETYLVEVRPAQENTPTRNTLGDLPDWVFRSSLAVWLAEGHEQIRERAITGERIKRQLAALAEDEIKCQ